MRIYSILLLGSAICLSIGGYLLLGVVPSILTAMTYVVVIVLLALSYLVEKGIAWALNLGFILGILAILSSSLSQAHMQALSQFGSSPRITILDALMVMGFYVFPVVYIVFWVRGRASRKSRDLMNQAKKD
ncbi:hypothetical protein L3N51_00630 [Metallosphaera sp. J1]|uniref:hypothetical protein n=1 Tax=Metallosphaera javensis (ex Hofmann et al. 2022) TaxID=99938 RepID=UPI001EDF5197|nr:hypothetical protein [Metallosphaera javensis (ex Hofmann et al. 2022)]MCG3108349.1 hypothetical protein [Metallosphaera javensis (ex Hofmann et al. 2022)]